VTLEKFPRRLIHRVENRETFPLIALSSVQELRAYLDEVEAESIRQAREMGASADDIAEALGITRQGAYYKLKQLQRANEAKAKKTVDDIGVTLPETEPSRPNPA
jgi:transcriptional regulator with PAS, ATPase and Fis domain